MNEKKSMADFAYSQSLKGIRETKKFIFVNLAIGMRFQGVNHGIAALIPILKQHKFDISVINLTDEIDSKDFFKKVMNYTPCIIGFSFTSHQFKYLKKYSKALGSNPHILQIAGGIHPTLDPEETLTKTDIDGVCVGEGEIPLDDLLIRISKSFDISDTRGFYWKQGETIKRNSIPSFINDLSSLPFPDYSGFNPNSVVHPYPFARRSLIVDKAAHKQVISVILSRGCPYNCSYCNNSALRNVYSSFKNYFRIPTVDYALKFLETLKKQYPHLQQIIFNDDLLMANAEWFLEFLEKYKKRICLPYTMQGRFELLTPKIAEALRKSGCVVLRLGLESGDENLRKKILNRMPSNELILEKAKLLKQAKIPICTLNMLGLPFEGKRQLQATLQLNKRIKPEFGTVCFFRPYKKTLLYDLCKNQGLIKSEKALENLTSKYDGPCIKMVDITESQCWRFYRKMQFYFFTQTFKYRCASFISSSKGINKLYLPIYIMKLLVGVFKIYYRDYINKEYKN